jgi:hypothetical protein
VEEGGEELSSEHAGAPLTACDRCGTFAELEDVAGRQLCQACRERRALRIDETAPTTGRLLRDVFAVIGKLHWRALMTIFLVQIPLAVSHLAETLPDWAYYAWSLIDVIADVALIQLTCSLATGETPRLGAALWLGLRRWPLLLITTMLSLLATGIGLLACVVPGVIVALGLMLAPALVGMERESPIGALRRSWEMMDGHKGALFGANLALGIGGAVADGMLRAVETALYELPAWETMPERSYWAVYYATTAGFTIFVYSIVYLPQRLLPAVLYVKLRGRDGTPRFVWPGTA